MFPLPLDRVDFAGSGFSRPESVQATLSGDVYAAHEHGISWLHPEGATTLIRSRGGPADFKANGIAILPGRSFLAASLGQDGGVWCITPDGTTTPYVLEADGQRLPRATNFVCTDRWGRTWITVTTRCTPSDPIFQRGFADGFLVLKDGRGARIVADGLAATNEAAVDAEGNWLYVNETFGRRLSRFAIRPDSSLGPKQVVTEFGAGNFPEGLAWDATGALWVTTVVGNRILRIDVATGAQQVVLDDADETSVAEIETRFQAGKFVAADLDKGRQRKLGNVSSMAFGGPDLRTVYLGSLFNDRLGRFRSPIAGAEPVHWLY